MLQFIQEANLLKTNARTHVGGLVGKLATVQRHQLMYVLIDI